MALDIETDDIDGGYVLDEFATGLQHTRITRSRSGQIHWTRSPGVDVADTYQPVPATYAAVARQASNGELRFVLPVRRSERRASWPVNGQRTLARALITGTFDREYCLGLARALGEGIARFHTHDSPGAKKVGFQAAPWTRRLQSWLDGVAGTRAAGAWRHKLSRQLGSARWRAVRELAASLTTPSRPDAEVITHGWFSSGVVILPDPAESESGLAVLSGLEPSRTIPEVDLGCLLGELAELHLSAIPGLAGASVCPDIARTMLEEYEKLAGTPDLRRVAAGSVSRIVGHSRDYAAHVGWTGALDSYVALVAKILDNDGDWY